MKHGSRSKSTRNYSRNKAKDNKSTRNPKQRREKSRKGSLIRPGASIERASRQKAVKELESDTDEESSVEICQYNRTTNQKALHVDSDSEDDESSKESDEEDEIPYKMAFSQPTTANDDGDSSSDSDGGGYESPSDDEHPRKQASEPLRPGDVIEYYNTMIFTAGSGMGHNTATILGTAPAAKFPLTLSTGDYLDASVRIRRTQEFVKGSLYKHSGYWKPISAFRLRKRFLRNKDGTRVQASEGVFGRAKAFQNLTTAMETKAVEFIRGDHDHRIRGNTKLKSLLSKPTNASKLPNEHDDSSSSSSSEDSEPPLELSRSKQVPAMKSKIIPKKPPGALIKSSMTFPLDSDDDSDSDSNGTLQFNRTKLPTPASAGAPPLPSSLSFRKVSRSIASKTIQQESQATASSSTSNAKASSNAAKNHEQAIQSTTMKRRSYGTTTVASKLKDAKAIDEMLLDSDDSDEDSELLAPVFASSASSSSKSPTLRKSPSEKSTNSNDTIFSSSKTNHSIHNKSTKPKSTASTRNHSAHHGVRTTNGFGRPKLALRTSIAAQPLMEENTVDIFEDSSGDDDSSGGSIYRRRNKRGERILRSPNLYNKQRSKGTHQKSMRDLLTQEHPVEERKPPSPSRRTLKRSVVVTGYQPLAISVNGAQPKDDSPPSIMKVYQRKEEKRRKALEKDNRTQKSTVEQNNAGETQERRRKKEKKESNRRKLQREKKKLKKTHARPPPYPKERSDPNLAEQSTQENEWSDNENFEDQNRHYPSFQGKKENKQRQERSSNEPASAKRSRLSQDSEEEQKLTRKKLTPKSRVRKRTAKPKSTNKLNLEQRKRYELSPSSDEDDFRPAKTPQTPWSTDCDIDSPFPSSIKIGSGVAHQSSAAKNSSGKKRKFDHKSSSVFDFNSQDEKENPFDKRHRSPKLSFAKMNNSSKSKSIKKAR